MRIVRDSVKGARRVRDAESVQLCERCGTCFVGRAHPGPAARRPKIGHPPPYPSNDAGLRNRDSPALATTRVCGGQWRSGADRAVGVGGTSVDLRRGVGRIGRGQISRVESDELRPGGRHVSSGRHMSGRCHSSGGRQVFGGAQRTSGFISKRSFGLGLPR